MHLPRKPGEQIDVDWAGDPAEITDLYTGEITYAWIFVGVMTYSQYAFVEAFINEKERAWIKTHVHMYEFFGGVTPILVPDNAPTATNRKQSDKSHSVLSRTGTALQYGHYPGTGPHPERQTECGRQCRPCVHLDHGSTAQRAVLFPGGIEPRNQEETQEIQRGELRKERG